MGDVHGRLSMRAGDAEIVIEPETHDAMVHVVLNWAARTKAGASGARELCAELGLDPQATQERSQP